jgi:ribosomal protein S18 acetylase RimI-like enzyme
MPEPLIDVRRATLADLDALVPLFDGYRQFYRQASDLEAARQFLSERLLNDESTLFLARGAAAVPLGFTQLFPSFSSVSMARSFVLNDLFVAPEARRAGVARALLGAAVAFCKARGAVRLSLSTEVSNTSAQAVYVASGWSLQTEYQVYTLKP